MLQLKFLSTGELDHDPLRRQVLSLLIEQLHLALPTKRNVYTEFTDHSCSCLLWQRPPVAFQVRPLSELRYMACKQVIDRQQQQQQQQQHQQEQVSWSLVSEQQLPEAGHLVVGKLMASADGALQVVDASGSLPVVFPSDLVRVLILLRSLLTELLLLLAEPFALRLWLDLHRL